MAVYVDSDELKATAAMSGESFADDDIDRAIASASRSCDYYRRDISPFLPVTQTRYYTPKSGYDTLRIRAINTLTSLTVDTDDNGTWDTTWTEGTHFYLEPANAIEDGHPFTSVCLIRRSGSWFPIHARSVKIVGSHGWLRTPENVKQAALEYALRLLHKARSAPLGIVAVGNEAVAAARLGSIDRNIAFLLDELPPKRPTLSNLQLS